jgi:hypothetical protein
MSPEMNSPNSNPADSAAPAANSEIAALRNQIFTLLVALIVVSGTLTVYLFRQVTVTGKELDAAKKLITAVNQDQNKIIPFANQLAAYSKTHPDIAPLLAKYGIGPNGIPTAAPAAPKK